MKYTKESCCDPKMALTGMSFEKKGAMPSSDGKLAMSFSKKAVPGGESRPSAYRLEGKKF